MRQLLTIIAWLLAVTPVLAVELDRQVDFNVPPQPLGAAVVEFSKQARIQIMADGQRLDGVPSKGLRGPHTIGNGLKLLLDGTGFGFKVVGTNTISLTSTTASAAGRGDDTIRLEPIVVSAQKRDERAFDVPISIVAMTSDELQKRQVQGIDDLRFVVPGLAVQSMSDTRRVFVRGVGNDAGNSSLIGIYLDEVPTTAGPFTQLDLRTYDLERVEVLRGPQGTLYGEGSVGGTIRFITKNPRLDRFSMTSNIATSFTQDGAPSQRIEAALNAPIIQNEMGIRVAATFDRQGGWIDQPAADQKDFNDTNLVNVRVKGLWRPTADLTTSVMAVVHRNRASATGGEDADGNYRNTFNLTKTPAFDDNYEIYNFTLTYDLPFARFLSATSYIDQYRETRNFGYRGPFVNPATTPLFELLLAPSIRDAQALSEELRLTSANPGAPWQWTAGVFYRRFENDTDQTAYVALPSAPGTPLPRPALSKPKRLSKSWAAFGDTSYEFARRLTVGAGMRYFSDEQTFRDDAVAAPFTQNGDFHATSPRVYVQYKFDGGVNTYASASKGFRSGGFNSQANAPSFKPESVWTYELGTKVLSSNGRLSADVALFYSDYRDYQVSGIPPPPAAPLVITSNAGDARIKGVEWGLTWRPVDAWTLMFNGNLVDSEFTKIDATRARYAVGDPLDLIPKYTYSVSVQRDFNWTGRPGFARLDYSRQGKASYRDRSIGPWYFSESDVIDLLNANVGIKWNSGLSFGIFGQNLLNDRGHVDPISILDYAVRARPRTVGVEVAVSF